MDRRFFCKTSSVFVLSAFTSGLYALEDTAQNDLDALVREYTKGKPCKRAFVNLDGPSVAENGLVVPMKVTVSIGVKDPLFPKKISLIAPKNPFTNICSIKLSKRNGRAYFSTRVKLAKSQNVIALVELGDGSFVYDARFVKVTIGGCG